ncbi:zinc fingers and homeoboxes protein 1 [Ambystoma mexicanum]|uniref:zinc fingers and homeoboxes protein 1 n=1 Tax=Ambystoma mexicanum TaxID=8296 RepID=UPI0037E80712
MASKRKSTTPCMILASEPDPDLEVASELDEGPPPLAPAPTAPYESTSSEEESPDNITTDSLENKPEGGYECKYCPFRTSELNKFTFHVDSEHPTIVLNSSYACVECNFMTKRYETLNEHNIKSHPGEENFKLAMVKRDNQTVFEQSINDLTFDGNFMHEENSEKAETAVSEEASGEAAMSGISISKTPIMKMMKNKVENKRIALPHNVGEDIPTERETDGALKQECDVVEPMIVTSETVNKCSPIVAMAQDTSAAVVTPTVFPPGLAQMITTVQAQQNCNLVSKVLIPVNSIPSYNLALDSNALLLNTYNKFPYPTASEISLLAAQAKCTEEQTKIWFSAQRLKHGVSWTPEEVEDARRKQFNGTVHTIPQTITVFPAHISSAANGLSSILQTCQIVGQPGLVLTQVAGANTLPVTAPIALTVAGVQNPTQLQKNNVQPVPPRIEAKKVSPVKSPQPSKHDNSPITIDPFGMRSKKTKEQLNSLKLSYLKNQFASEEEIDRLIKCTGLTKGEIKKWFSDTRYNQRNSKSSQGIHFPNDSNNPILIDSSDEMTESPTMVTPQRRPSWNPFPDFTLQKFKEKTAEQLQVLEESFVKNPMPADEELGKLRALTKLTRREIDAWFSEKRRTKEIKEEDEMEVNENEDAMKEQAEENTPESGLVTIKSESSATKVAKKSPEQLHLLKAAFVRSQWPSSEEYDKIAQESGIPRSDIVSWFGDARYSWKNGHLKWYYYYQCGSGANTQNGQTCSRRRGRGRPRGRGRGRPRGRPKGARRTHWNRASLAIKFKTGKTILKDYYLKHKFLNEQDLDELVAKSHMGYEQVREWFAERVRREESGMEPFEENEDHEENEEEMIEDIDEDEDVESDDSDTWEPPRHVRRRLSKTDD